MQQNVLIRNNKCITLCYRTIEYFKKAPTGNQITEHTLYIHLFSKRKEHHRMSVTYHTFVITLCLAILQCITLFSNRRAPIRVQSCVSQAY